MEIHQSLLAAKNQANMLPDILVQAKQLAHSLVAGWHGRRQAGSGDIFWQFRNYNESESTAKIDWRRTARDNSLTIRDQEWQAAISFWLWADCSPSMQFGNKQNKAFTIMLTLAELLARSGERVGCPDICNPSASKKSAEIIVARLQQKQPKNNLPNLDEIGKHSHFIFVSDFLMEQKKIETTIHNLAKKNVKGMFIHVIEPAEENFPFAGHTEFLNMSGKNKIIFKQAENVKSEYIKLFTNHKQAIKDLCKKAGWWYLGYHTNNSLQNLLSKAHTILQGAP